jgi:B12-binding domain/radical SAM domain protein
MYDIVFLHPPSSFDKIKYPLSGVFGALVGSTDILGHEPVGMITMAHDLSRRGYKTKIFNVGKILLDLRYQGVTETSSIRDFIKNLQANIYAIGLHWAAHGPGAIELARVIKEYHPEGLVLLGGITATYYHKEIIEKFQFVDLVALGELDGLIHEIVEMLLGGQPYGSIPNICYRKSEKAVSTPLRPPLKDNLCYVRGQGSELIEPNTGFSREGQDDINNCMIPLVHGCQLSCPFCGGSRHFYKRYFSRNKAEVMSAEDVITNIKRSIYEGASGVSLFGDVRYLGDPYWRELTHMLAEEHLHFDLYLELFSPATPEYMAAWRNVTSGQVIIALSPESGDPDVRQALGKNYSNEDIIEQVALATDLGVSLSLGFLFALPKQDFASIVRTQDFINDLCHRFNRLISYMFEPLLFIDPGSLIFDNPKRYGYELEDRTLAGLIEALSRPHWYFSLNYSTKWMSKKEIIDAMFFVGSSRNALYMAFLGPSEENLFHKRLIAQHKELVNILEQDPNLGDEAIKNIIEKTVDQEFRHMNFSITGPDLDFVQQRPTKYSMGRVLRNAVRVISQCYSETKGEKDLLSVLEEIGIFGEGIPVETYKEQMLARWETEDDIYEISIRPPKRVWKKLDDLVSALGLSLEKGLVEDFVKYDWAVFLVNLYVDTCIKDLYEKRRPPKDIGESEVWLPLKNAYVKLKYKHRGQVVKKPSWLTVERGPTYVLISYTGETYPVTKQVFGFLRGCGYRIPFGRFYEMVMNFVEEPEHFMDWLLSHGFILFGPADLIS